jgi:hypothetical protein
MIEFACFICSQLCTQATKSLRRCRMGSSVEARLWLKDLEAKGGGTPFKDHCYLAKKGVKISYRGVVGLIEPEYFIGSLGKHRYKKSHVGYPFVCVRVCGLKELEAKGGHPDLS